MYPSVFISGSVDSETNGWVGVEFIIGVYSLKYTQGASDGWVLLIKSETKTTMILILTFFFFFQKGFRQEKVLNTIF